mgnify:FL=1|tara:strand:- start:1988 stop:2539 length:552 start_codon:yes stop_codon:yes gene_type:complete
MIVEARYKPFRWWWIEDCLNGELLGWLNKQEANSIALDGRRAATNDERTWISRGPVARYFDKTETRKQFEEISGVNFDNARTRIELCNDYATEIQLDPHIDIVEKLMTLQIYLKGDAWCGTDLYADPQDPPVTRVPFDKNCGWLVVDKDDSWHGLERRQVKSPRKSLIVNYVVGNWQDEEQLV